MNKSILVIDTPACCGECRFARFFDHDFESIDMVCTAIKQGNFTSFDKKPRWCPLRTPLKAVDKDYYIYRTDYLFENLDREIELLKSAKRFKEHMKSREENEC